MSLQYGGMAVRAVLSHAGTLTKRDRVVLTVLGTLAVSATAFAMAVAAQRYHAGAAIPDASTALAVLLAFTAAAAFPLYLHLAYQRVLSELHRAILLAQEGTLKPITPGTTAPDGLLHQLVADYNSLITSLGTTFAEMEEVQNRVIGERNRNDAILHSLPGALLCVDGDHRINLYNRQAATLFGREPLLGESLFDLLQLEDAGRELLRDAFLYEREIANREMSLSVAGETRYFTLNLSFFRSRNLNEVGAAVILQDITDYKRLQESTYTSEKLMAMGELAAGVAHELNTPLGNIIGYARLIEQAMPGAGAVCDYTAIVSQEAKRCSRIVDDLLHYGRRDRCGGDTCEINTVVQDVVTTINDCQGRRLGVHVSTELGDDGVQVRGSAGQLDIVLVNVVMNAIQAVHGRSAPQVVVRTGARAGGHAVITIEDNGPGIPRELHRRVFDPFFTTKEVGEGTGLGLAVSQSIVTRLGGTLAVDPEFSSGARLLLKLPLA